MKTLIFIITMMFCFCCHAYSQTTKHIEQDTLPVKITRTNYSLNLPILKKPKAICEGIKAAWKTYIQDNKAQAEEFWHLDEDSYFHSSIEFIISSAGTVLEFGSQRNGTRIDTIVIAALTDLIQKSKWTPAYTNTKEGKIYVQTKAIISLTIKENGIAGFECKDLYTSRVFFTCKCK